MKLRNLIACLFIGFTVTSCIQDEAKNSEAAIDGCKGADVQFTNINTYSKNVKAYVHKGSDLTAQELIFTLPQGATIKANESKPRDKKDIYDFSDAPHTRLFTVTSEDGVWKEVYTIEITPTELPSVFHFENLVESFNTPYHELYEFEPSSSEENIAKVLQWSSGNPGFNLTGMAKAETDFPTVQVTDGRSGKCVKLTTRDTGSFGALVKMYIAAGNLFIGSFNVGNALADAPKATGFGFQFYKYPEFLQGYYKFKAGDVYTEGGVPVSGKDKCDIYAIMYEAEDNSFMLDGYNSLDSDKLVSVARLPQDMIVESDSWTYFDIPFEGRNGKEIDETKLKEGKYKLSIVLSSSVNGAYFKGAVGSTLYVDELVLVSKEDK